MLNIHIVAVQQLEKFIYIICTVIVLTVLCIYLPDPYLWYDEAGQFWISQGLNHYSDPYSPVGSICDVLRNNRGYNMDPGGFSVVLYYWQRVSTHWLFLRMLPTLFFICFTYCIYRIISKETGDRYYALLTATLFYILPIFTNRIVELRGYSMELFGTALCLLLLINLKKQQTYRNILILSFVEVVFCTTRYSFVIVAFCISLRVIFLLFKQNPICSFANKIVIYSLPLILICALIYWEMMRFQSSEGAVITYAGYISSDIRLLFSPMSIIFYLLLILLLKSYIKFHNVNEVILLSSLVCGVFFFLSIIGLYPWDMHRTISAFFLMTLSIIMFIIEIIKNSNNIKVVSLCGITVFFVLFLAFFDRIHKKETDTLIYEFDRFVDENEFKRMFVQVHMTPVIRYQYEYGILKDRCISDKYPSKFIFQIGLPHNMHTSEAPFPKDDYDIVWSTASDSLPLGCFLISGYSNFYKHKN